MKEHTAAIIFVILCMAVLALLVILSHLGMKEISQATSRKEAISKYYNDRMCANKGCKELTIDCAEYCYDLEVKK